MRFFASASDFAVIVAAVVIVYSLKAVIYSTAR